MLTLLHISDLHFGSPYVPAAGEALLRIAEELAPDVIVVSGDFTQRARHEQFAAARTFLNELPETPRLVVPGNHDIPLFRIFDRIFRPRDLYRRYISPQCDQVLRVPGAVIVGLDSTAPRRAITNGRIHAAQLDFCERAMADAPDDAVRIVVAHHHFAPAPDYKRDQVMPKAKRAMDRFVRLGVDIILGGHLHRAYIGNSLDVYAGPAHERGIMIVQCGTSTSRRGRGRERQKNSFNVIHVGDEHRVTHFMYFEDKRAFAPVSRHLFPGRGRRTLSAEPARMEPCRPRQAREAHSEVDGILEPRTTATEKISKNAP
jgi:3',5'-cyclic AMP phosphodiesterase CpdA